MKSLPVILTIDIGTTSAKVMFVRHDGTVLADYVERYSPCAPHAGWEELDTKAVWNAVRGGLHSLVASQTEKIAGISLCSTMHSLLAVDARGEPLTPCITRADTRAASQADQLKHVDAAAGLQERTGAQLLAMSPLCKIIWLRENEPEIFAAAAKFVSIKEFILFKLTGQWLADYSIASATGLFNNAKLAWDDDALRLAGIDAARLPALVPPAHVLQTMRDDVAASFEMSSHLPLVVGAADGPLSNLGAGAVKPGVLSLTAGAGAAISTWQDRPVADPGGRLFCHALTERDWIAGGSVTNGGLAFAWLEKTFGFQGIREIAAAAQTVAPGAEGLRILPLLSNEQFPDFRTGSSGLVLGLTARHDRRHFARATAEGVAFMLGCVLANVERVSGPAKEIRAGGGAVETPFMRQLLADMLDRRVVLPATFDAASLGAARLGFRALGMDKDWSHAAAIACPAVHKPDEDTSAFYASWRLDSVTLYRYGGVMK